MIDMPFVLGIDGGGSRTRAVLVTTRGFVVGHGCAGPSNIHDIGLEGMRAALDLSVTAAWNMAGATVRPAQAVFLGMASALSNTDVAAIRNMALALRLAAEERILVDHDIRVALAGGLAGDPGIALIAGTGSSCYGRMVDGRGWIAGGWSFLDDLGSSWHLGMQAMTAAVQAYDGRGPATVLEEAIMNALDISRMPEILHRLHVIGLSRTQIAALAPLVMSSAESGDEVAKSIVAQGASELARMAVAVADRLQAPPDVSVTAAGGLVTGSAYYRKAVAEALRSRLPDCCWQDPILPPVLGAALLALEAAGVPRSPSIVAALRAFKDDIP